MRNIKNIVGKYIVLLCMIVGTMLLTACTDIDGDLASEKEVKKRVASEVQGDHYTLTSVEHFTQERPKRDVYHFSSKDRELEFEAISTLAAFGIDDATLGYNESIRVEYAQAVKALYQDRIQSVMNRLPQNEKGRFVLTSFQEIQGITEALLQADAIWKEELSYNSTQWLSENPFESYSFYFQNEEKTEFVFAASIDGSLEKDDLYAWLAYQYAEKCKLGHIEDSSVPQEQLARVRPKRLTKIFMGQENLSESLYEKARAANFVNNSHSDNSNDFYAAYYYYPGDTYIVLLNVGLTDDNYAPQWVEGYTEALGCPALVQYGKGKVSWTRNGKKWEIKASQMDRDIPVVTFYCDGKEQDIRYFTHYDKGAGVNGTYVIGLTVEDFAKIIEVSYRIEEDMKCLFLDEDASYYAPLVP